MSADNEERQLAYKVRQVLAKGTESLDPSIANRLYAARQQALAAAPVQVGGLSLAGVSRFVSDTIRPHSRVLVMITTLLVGAAVASYWNNYMQADDNEEIDSALLADDLPINAYLDPGFHTWLERNTPPSPQ